MNKTITIYPKSDLDRISKARSTEGIKSMKYYPGRETESVVTGLVDGPTMLRALFHEPPTLRWLRTQTAKRAIPFRKIGGMVLFDVEEVRNYFNSKCAVKP